MKIENPNPGASPKSELEQRLEMAESMLRKIWAIVAPGDDPDFHEVDNRVRRAIRFANFPRENGITDERRDKLKQEVAWAFSKWRRDMSPEEFAQTIVDSPSMATIFDDAKKTEAAMHAEFERGWSGGFKLGHRLGTEGKPSNYPANLSQADVDNAQ